MKTKIKVQNKEVKDIIVAPKFKGIEVVEITHISANDSDLREMRLRDTVTGSELIISLSPYCVSPYCGFSVIIDAPPEKVKVYKVTGKFQEESIALTFPTKLQADGYVEALGITLENAKVEEIEVEKEATNA